MLKHFTQIARKNPRGTYRAPEGPKKGRKVLKHHQTTFWEGRNKKTKNLGRIDFSRIIYNSLIKRLKNSKKMKNNFFCKIQKNASSQSREGLIFRISGLNLKNCDL